jgi:sulfite reductase (ferredoxin)
MLNYHLPPGLDQDIRKLEEEIQAFNDGRLHKTAFVARRVLMGIYLERGDRTYMCRIRCAGNIITPDQLQKVAELARTYGQPRVHVTSRAELQLHGVRLEDTPAIIRALAGVGLCMKGGGGHTVRNITANHDSGIHPDELFDVQPYALALTGRLLAEEDSCNLPRKLKISLSSLNHDTTSSAMQDLGFVATWKDNAGPGFKVYCGGGLGMRPKPGVVLEGFIPCDKILHVIRAVKNIFHEHGNRRSKHHSRIRFLIHEDMGVEKFRECYRRAYDKIRDDHRFDLDVVPIDNIRNIARSIDLDAGAEPHEGYAQWRRRHVKRQRQKGLYHIRLPLLLGDLDCDDVLRLVKWLHCFGDNVLRCGTDQNIYLRNIPERHLPWLHRRLRSLRTLTDKPPLYATVMPCTGAQTCQLGINYPRPAVEAVFAHLDRRDLNLDDLGDVNIRISGCPNGCANHWNADLGFFGKVRRIEGRPIPTYNVVGGGRDPGGRVRLAERAGWVHARDLPRFLGRVLEHYAAFTSTTDGSTAFGRYWESKGRAFVTALCADHFNTIPTIEKNRQYYYDHGSDEIFSTRNISGEAECSAGIYDMIAVDEKAVRGNLDRIANFSGDSSSMDSLLRETLFFATRMLLVTRGEEAVAEEDAYRLFVQHFIDRHLIAEAHRTIVDIALDSGTCLSSHADAVTDLAESVLALYRLMDDTMHFPQEASHEERTRFQASPRHGTGNQPQLPPDRFKDLRGVKCPINFAQTKIQLAGMQRGQILEIYLDDGDPIHNVPGSVRLEGHEIVDQTKMDACWSVVIRKA